MQRDCFTLKLICSFLLTLLAQPVHAENAGYALGGLIPGFLWTLMGGYVFIVGLVLAFKGCRSLALTILLVIMSLALSIFFFYGVWQSTFCSAAHPLFLLPLSSCQQVVLVWLCLLPFLIGLPMAQCYAWHTEHASRRALVWFIAIPGLIALALVWGNRVDALIAALSSPKPFVRVKAVHALARSSDPRAVAPLLAAAVHDTEYPVRLYARQALIHIGVPAIAPLSAILQGGDKAFHNMISDILVHIGGPQVVEPLIVASGLKDRRNRYKADRMVIQGLVSIGAPAVEPLITVLEDTNNTFTNREQAVEALGKIGDARAIVPLSGALRDDNTNVAWKAAIALRTIGNAQAVDALIAALNDHQLKCRWCVVSPFLASPEPGKLLTDPRAVEPLIAMLTSNDGDLRSRAEIALRNIGAPAIEPLSAKLNDNTQAVRLAACMVLRTMGKDPAVEPLIGTLKDHDQSGGVDRCLKQ
jgi:HEAT repeat protein